MDTVSNLSSRDLCRPSALLGTDLGSRHGYPISRARKRGGFSVAGETEAGVGFSPEVIRA